MTTGTSTRVFPENFVDHLSALAAERPHDSALVIVQELAGAAVDTAISYAALERRVRALAAHLQLRFAPGERALLMLDNDDHYVVAFMACLYAGLIAVPVFAPESSRQQHLGRLTAIVSDARARCIMTTSAIAAMLGSAIQSLSDVSTIAVDAVSADAADAWKRHVPRSSDIAFLQYTSGSTSAPKGVMVTHGNLMANERAIERGLSVQADDVFVSWLPLFHDMGLIGGLLQPLHRGIKVVLMTPKLFIKRPIRWLEAIDRHRGTISGGPDFAYRMCVERTTEEQLRALDLSCWKLAFCGAEPVRRDTLDAWTSHMSLARFAATSLFPCYGLAEATLFVSGVERGGELATERFSAASLGQGPVETSRDGNALVGCGKVAAEHELRIADTSSGAPLESGRVGEIWVSGASVATGYWDKPDETKATFPVRDGRTWLRTGDLGFLHHDQLYITGRIKDLIIVRGHNVYPRDIERAIADEVEAVHRGQVAAFAVEGPGGEGIGIAVEVSPGMQKLVTAPVLVQALMDVVSELFAEPPTVVVLLHPGALPKTSSGKLQRNACRVGWTQRSLNAFAIFERGQFVLGGVAASAQPVLSELEASLAAHWRHVLRLAPNHALDREAHFFSHGGNSVSAVQLAARVAESWDVELDLRTMFESPRLGDMARQIAARRGATPTGRTEIRAIASVQRGDALRLSHAQERQWFLWQLDRESAAYHVGVALRCKGSLNRDALQLALRELATRHEALRTGFELADDGTPRQRVRAVGEIALSMSTLPEHELGGRDALVAEAVSRVSGRAFDLLNELPVRAALLRCADDDHVLVLVMNHISSDGASLQVLVDELAARYRAHTLHEVGAPLGALAVQYVDYAAWQRQWLAGGESERLVTWWQDELGAAPAPLVLPTDFPRAAQASYRAARHSFDLPTSLLKALRARGEQQSASLFMVLLAGFQALLHKQTGETDIRVGVPVAGRQRRGTEGVVGLFVNTLVLRNAMSGRDRVGELLTRTKEAVLNAHAHQDLPFERLLEATCAQRSVSTSPLFQVVFNHLREDHRALADLPGLAISCDEIHEQHAQFELSLDTREAADGAVRATFTYAAELFRQTTIERLADHFLRTLAQLAEHPERRLHELSLVSPGERTQLDAWSCAQAAPEGEPVHRLIAQQARVRANAAALICGEQTLNFGELDGRANQLAHRLIDLGARHEVKVAISVQEPVEMVVAILAVLKAGAAYLLLDPSYPAERLAYILSDSDVSLLLAERGQTLALPADREVLRFDVDAGDVSAAPTRDPNVEVSGQGLAYVIYTSGSTGLPKAVVNSHASLSGHLHALAEVAGLAPEDRSLQLGSVTFDGFIDQLFAPLAVGASVVVCGRALLDSDTVHREIVDKGISYLDLSTAYWQLLVQSWASGGPRDFGRLRRVHLGGEALHAASLSAWRDAGLGHLPLFNCYGPTEATVDATAADCAAYDEQVSGYVPIGRPLRGRQVYVLDAELSPVPVGVIGELYIGGSLLARGYGGRPGLTASRFVASPFAAAGGRLYRTGDLVRWRDDGQLDYVGRSDQQLKVRGFRVEPGEIEALLLTQPEVKEVAVVARPSPVGARLFAYVSLHVTDAITGQALRQRLVERLPDYMVPAALVVLQALPLNSNGKIDRAQLPEPDLASDRPHEPPRGKEEQALAQVWSEALGVGRVGRNDNFFELGGNSLLLLKVQHALAERGLAATVVDLFRYPTIESLAVFLRGASIPAAPGVDVDERARRQRGVFLAKKPASDRTER